MSDASLTSNALIPELAVADWSRSRAFYVDLLGFEIVYERPEEGFSFLAIGDAQLMIDQIGVGRTFERDGVPFEPPLGLGMNLQIRVSEVDPLLERLRMAEIELYLPVEEKWYGVGETAHGNRQFVVADPDGYLLRFYEDLGSAS